MVIIPLNNRDLFLLLNSRIHFFLKESNLGYAGAFQFTLAQFNVFFNLLVEQIR